MSIICLARSKASQEVIVEGGYMAEEILMKQATLQEAWLSIETALHEAMERYDFPIPPGVRAGARATFSTSKLVGKGILNPQEAKLFHDIRAFKDGTAQWTRDANVIESAWMLVEYIREA
jgi:hypothetical protein